MKSQLLGRTLEDLTSIGLGLGLRRFAGAQLAAWLYGKRAFTIDQMTNLSKGARELLNEKFEVGMPVVLKVQTAKDGTRKYLFQGNFEAVYIPSPTSRTLCISSQVGCRMGCKFCMTGHMGFGRNLTAGEIVGQLLAVQEAEVLTNVVFMGMGEPLDNLDNVMRAIDIITSTWGMGWSPTRITLSTIGVHAGLAEFLERSKANLAISLHNPFPAERASMMPSEGTFGIVRTVEMIKDYDFAHQRRVSFEYILFEGVNDSARHVAGIVKLLGGVGSGCRVNLIRFHSIEGSDLRSSSDEAIKRFNTALNRAGILTTTRTSRGEDVMAACGMLAATRSDGV